MLSAEIFFSVCLADHDNGIENRCLADIIVLICVIKFA